MRGEVVDVRADDFAFEALENEVHVPAEDAAGVDPTLGQRSKAELAGPDAEGEQVADCWEGTLTGLPHLGVLGTRDPGWSAHRAPRGLEAGEAAGQLEGLAPDPMDVELEAAGPGPRRGTAGDMDEGNCEHRSRVWSAGPPATGAPQRMAQYARRSSRSNVYVLGGLGDWNNDLHCNQTARRARLP